MMRLGFKLRVPVDIAEIRVLLEQEFPEYTYSLYGLVGKALIVRQSSFRGVRVVVTAGRVGVSLQPPGLIASFIDAILRGVIGDTLNRRTAERVTALLQDRLG